MIETYDVGSMPFIGNFEKFSEGAIRLVYQSGRGASGDSVEYFERKIVESFIDKLDAGIDVPNYPQFRDMNKMFFEMMSGIEKRKEGYFEAGVLSLRGGKADIPEVLAIRRSSKEICERSGGAFRLKICITGPYTLSSLFAYRDPQIYGRLSDVLLKIVEGNIFDDGYGGVTILAVDEPVFGLIDDPMIDVGSGGRKNLMHAWENICHKAVEKGVETCLHLHSTADELFWGVDSLRIVESHVGDALYSTDRTKKLLESNDKFLKASVCVSDFDKLIRKRVLSSPRETRKGDVAQRIGEVWREIDRGKVSPDIFLESAESMEEKLREMIRRFGSERVPYAGPECGLRGFPTYECAVECLRRVSKATKLFHKG